MKKLPLLLASLAWPSIAAAQEAVDDPPAPVSAPTPAAAPAPASAPTPAPAPPPRNDFVEVRVIGNRPDSLQKVPGSGTLVTAQEIKRAEPYTVAEMLNRVPGVIAHQEAESGARLDIGIRGVDPGRSRHLLVLEDGIPLAINLYAEPDLYVSPAIERMRGIEIVKGSGSILFGPQTITGVINFLTLAPPARETATLDARVGSYNYARGIAQYGNTIGSARYVVQAVYKQGDGPTAQPFKTFDAFTKVAFDTSKEGQATLKLDFHDDATIASDVGLTRGMYDRDPSTKVLDPHDRMHQRRYAASLVHEESLGTSTKLRTLVYAYETQRLWRRQDFTRTSAGAPAPTDFERFVGDFDVPGSGIYFRNTDTILDRVYDVAGLEPRLETRFETAGIGHTLEYGARILGETAHYEQRAGTMPDSDSGDTTSIENHRTIGLAAYAQDRIAFRDDLLVTPGLRLEHADFHDVVLRRPLTCATGGGACAQDVNEAGDTSSAGVIPGIGMTFGTREASVFAGSHVGWAPPRVSSSFNANGTTTKVDPERSLNHELGVRLAPRRHAHLDVAGFLTNYQNQIIAGSGGGAQLVNGGTTRHLGVEATATYGLGRALDWPTQVDLRASYTFVRAAFVGGPYDGNIVPYSAMHNLSAIVDVEHPSGVAGQLAMVHVSSQFADASDTRAADATGQIGLIPAHTTLDANARYKWAKAGLTFRLIAKNLLDQRFIADRRPQGIGVGGFREILLGVTWEWEAKPPSDAK